MSASHSSLRGRLVTIGHFLTAFVLATEGVAHLEHVPVPWWFVTLCWVSAATIVAVVLAHRRIERHFPALQSLAHMAEGIVCSALAFITHHEGKVYLPFVWVVAAAVLFARSAFEIRGRRRDGGAIERARATG